LRKIKEKAWWTCYNFFGSKSYNFIVCVLNGKGCQNHPKGKVTKTITLTNKQKKLVFMKSYNQKGQ